ncbi:MAG TPA: acyl-CoA dehydrogenase family protein [Rhizobiaceae bacterium]|nr:acyl-CoA dehydrogenase family protein [Rhizobiaceae bacterium]
MSSLHSWVTAEHEAYAETVRRFLAAEFTPNRERWTRAGVIDQSFWKKAGEAGLLGASMPEIYGGSALPRSFDIVTFLEQARFGDTGWAALVHNIVMRYIAAFGTDAQKGRWLPPLISGELIGAIAMTEPDAGSDLQSIRTTARHDGEHYVVNGSKTYISNGQTANLIIVVAKTAPDQRARGISLLVLDDVDTAGFSRGRNLDKIGMWRQDTSELFFENVPVPAFNLLGGEEGQGFFQLMRELSWERLIIGFTALGSSERALALTLEHVRDRKAFGKRLLELQDIRFKLAKAKTEIELLRALLDSCLADMELGTLTTERASMVKWWGTEMQGRIVDDCLQMHGGLGYMAQSEIAQLYVDARVQRIYGGANEVLMEVVARSLERA